MDQHDDHDDCALCLGRSSAHRGEPGSANPFPPADLSDDPTDWCDSDHYLWLTGHALGSTEPGGEPWYSTKQS